VSHDVSVSAHRSERMSPTATALAVLLHVAVAALLWWLTMRQPAPLPVEEPIEVTLEQPKPKTPEPPPPPPPPKPPTVVQTPEGLRPPAAITAEKATQVPTMSSRPTPGRPTPDLPPQPDQAPPPKPQLEQAVPPPPKQTTAPAVTAFATPKPTPAPTEPTPNAHAVPVPAPAPAKPTPPKPAAPPPRPELRPSPLSTAPQRRAPQSQHVDPPSSSPFVNPADVYNRAKVADNYLWQVANRLVGYRYNAKVDVSQAITVVRIVIARDGRLLDASIASSSGYPVIDNGVLAGVRAGAPYAPLPPDIKGDSASFNLPLVSVNR
jgi:TonB family protein